MCLHVGVKVADDPPDPHGDCCASIFQVNTRCPFPCEEYVLGERDVAAARPRKRNPNKYLCNFKLYKVWSFARTRAHGQND